jgi:hypothetical protein
MLPGLLRVIAALALAGKFKIKFFGSLQYGVEDAEAAPFAGEENGLAKFPVLVQDSVRKGMSLFPPPGKYPTDSIRF